MAKINWYTSTTNQCKSNTCNIQSCHRSICDYTLYFVVTWAWHTLNINLCLILNNILPHLCICKFRKKNNPAICFCCKKNIGL